MTASHNAGDLL